MKDKPDTKEKYDTNCWEDCLVEWGHVNIRMVLMYIVTLHFKGFLKHRKKIEMYRKKCYDMCGGIKMVNYIELSKG